MGHLANPLILAVLVASASAVPTGSRQTCATTCSDATKFSYDTGFSYNYQYEVETTSVKSPYSSDEDSKMNIKGKATVGVIAPCEFVLTLSDVELEGSSESNEFSRHLEKNPLKFGFDDGKISSVCSSNYDKEHEWVLNFKRGILSSFQNSMKKMETEVVPEIDVTGTCDTKYTILKTSSDDEVVVKKEKMSSECSRTPAATHTTLPAPLQNLPIISADQMCNQTITAGIMSKVECKESLVLKALPGVEDNPVTVVTTKIIYEGLTTGVVRTGGEFSQETIQFTDKNKEKHNIQDEFMMVEKILGELQIKTFPVLDSEVPALFSDLVSHLRFLDSKHLDLIYQSNKGTRVWKILIDALPLIGTPASTTIVSKLIKQNDLSKEEAEVWYASLAYIQNPKSGIFKPLSEVLKEQNSNTALIGAASLVKNFCKNNADCMKIDGITAVISAMENKLGSACRSTNVEEKSQILTVLRSLTIAGVWNRQDILENCFLDERNTDDVRVAALNAFVSAPCSYDRSKLMSVYSDVSYDSEIRISAYLSLMACPAPNLIDTIKEKLESESVNQVGTFVWTHLSNLQESASHEKQWIRLLIGDDDLAKKFNSTELKFSRNIESSFYMEGLGTGSTIESNVIFSKKSFLPRSGMFNFSVDLFGENLNLFEVGGRFEGFEIFAEKFFGPNGYYPEETIQSVIRGLRQSKSQDETTLEGSFEKINDEPEGSYYLRILGNDVHYRNFHGIDNFFEKTPKFDVNEFISRLVQTGKTGYSHTYQIMDTELSYPTISGLPLKIKLSGSATLGLNMDGDFKFNSFKDIDINGHIYPSTAVEFDASMLIDAQYAKSGMKQLITGQTSLMMEGSIKVESGKIVDIDIKMPKEKEFKIISLKSEVEMIGSNVEMGTSNEIVPVKTCSSASILGIDFCEQHIYEKNHKEVAFYINNNDEHDSYHLKISKEQNKMSFLVDTPNSVVDRRIYLESVQYGNEITIDVQTPWKSLKLNGMLSKQDMKLSCNVMVDAKQAFEMVIDSNIVRGNLLDSYFIASPSLVIRSSSKNILSITGDIERKVSEKTWKITFHSKGLIEFSADVSGSDKTIKANIVSNLLKLNSSGSLILGGKVQSHFDLQYSIQNGPLEKMNMFFKLQKDHTEIGYGHNAIVKFSTSSGLNLSANLKVDVEDTDETFETKTKLIIGNDYIVVQSEYQRMFTSGYYYDIKSSHSVVSKDHNLDLDISKVFRVSSSDIVINSKVKYGEIILKNELEGNVTPQNGFLKTVVEMPHHFASSRISYNQLGDRQYSADMTATYNDMKFEGNGVFHDKSSFGKNVDFGMELRSSLNGISKEIDIKIEADDKSVSINFEHRTSTTLEFFKLRGTSSFLSLDMNLYKPISLETRINMDGPEKHIEVSGSIDDRSLESSLVLSTKKIDASFMFGNFMKKFIGELMNDGANVIVYLSPNEKIEGSVRFDFGSASFLSLSLETPFIGYYKQDLNIQYKQISANEFSAQMSATWKNKQLVSVQTKAKIGSGNAKVDLTINSDKEYLGLSRGTFSFDHKMIGFDFNSHINGNVDGVNVIESSFITASSGKFNKKADLMLKSKFTDEFKASVELNTLTNFIASVEYGNKKLNTSYEMKTKHSGHELHFVFNSPQITAIDGKASIIYEGKKTTISAEGTFDGLKYSASFMLNDKSTVSDKEYELTWRIIRPHVSPIRGNFNLAATKEGKYTMNVNFNRFWSDFESIKLHTALNIDPSNKIKLRLTLVTPESKASIDSAFRYESTKLSAIVKMALDENKYIISADGSLDGSKKIAFNGKLVQNESTLFKSSFKYEIKSKNHSLRANVEMLGFIINLMDQLTIHDSMMNFENVLEADITIGGKKHHSKIESDVLMMQKKIRMLAMFGSEVYGFSAIFQPNSTDEKAILEIIKNNEKYNLRMGGDYKDDRFNFDLRLETPIRNLEDIHLATVINNSPTDKHVMISLENSEGNLVSLKINLIGDFMEMELLSPFEGIRNFHSYGSLNRNKRSVEFSMASDEASAGLIASFNSLSVNVKSSLMGPSREGSINIKKENGVITFDYHRDNFYLNFKAEPAGRRRSFNITLKSEIPGWEFLALTGRLDGEELMSYISGQKNAEKMSIEGGGRYSRSEGDLKFQISTPYKGYESVDFTLKYNLRRNRFNLQMVSKTSDFEITVKSQPKLSVNLYIPNQEKPTIIKGDFSLFSSRLSASSRFSFLKSFSYEHSVSMQSQEISVSTKIEYNGLEVFKLMYTNNRTNGKTHLMIDGRRGNHHSQIHFEKLRDELIEFSFERDGRKFKLNLQGNGNMPRNGKYTFVINNEFRETPKTVSGQLIVDRTRTQKKISLAVTFPQNKLYKFDLKYEMNLRQLNSGVYELKMRLPGRGRMPTINGSWDMKNHDNVNINFSMGDIDVHVTGKMHLLNSDIQIKSKLLPEPFKIQWNYHKEHTASGRVRDHYVKVGVPSRFVMFKLKGTFNGLSHGDGEITWQVSHYMSNPFELKASWSRSSDGISGKGSFEYGTKHGSVNLKQLKRDASTRSLNVSFEANSNIPGFKKLTVEGSYSFNNEAVVHLDINWDISKISLHFDIKNIMNKKTNQTASFSLPGLGDVQLTFGHDFRRNKKKFRIIAKYGGRESHFKADWTKNKDFTVGSGNIDVQSRFIGHLTLNMEYNVRNLNDAHAKIEYKRGAKFFNINWARKVTSNDIMVKLTFESSNKIVPSAKIEVHGVFTDGFALDVIMQRSERIVNLKFKLNKNGIEGELHTPYQGFEHTKGSIVYDIRRPVKTASLRYERGNKKIDMDISVKPNMRKGEAHVSLSTPYDFVKTLKVDADWQNGHGNLEYKRNDNAPYKLSGDFNIKNEGSSMDLVFLPSGGSPVKISFKFNAGSLLTGRGDHVEKIAKLELEILQKKIKCELDGYRSSSKLYLDFEFESTFDRMRHFEFKLDSELSTMKREGLFELKADDFYFKVKNHFERLSGSDFYWRSEFDSSLTQLPGLVIGFGIEDKHIILTAGTGEGKEFTLKFIIEDKKISGEFSIPSLSINDAYYEASYQFSGRDTLNMDLKINLQPGKQLAVNVVYDSDGVQGRLSSSFLGNHSARVRRSISHDGFLGEVGFDNHRIFLSGNLLRNTVKKGFLIKGEVLGHTVSIDALVENHSQKNGEIRFIVETSFEGFNKLGGKMAYTVQNGTVSGQSELYIPSSRHPKVTGFIEIQSKSDGFYSKLGLNISDMAYLIEISPFRKLSDGFEARILIETPCEKFANVNIHTKLRTNDFKTVDAELSIDYPKGNLNFNLMYDILRYNINSNILIDLTLENTKVLQIISKIKSASNKLEGEMSLNSKYLLNSIGTEFLIEKENLSDFRVKVTARANGFTYTTEFETEQIGAKQIIKVIFTSPDRYGRHFINLEHNLIDFLKTKNSLEASLIYSGASTSSVDLILSKEIANVKVILPSGQYELEGKLNEKQVTMFFQCPQGEHEMIFNMHKQMTKQDKSFKYDLKLKSPFLTHNIDYKIQLDVESLNKFTFETVLVGEKTHSLKAEYFYTVKNIEIIMDLETTLLDINHLGFTTKISSGKNNRVQTSLVLMEQTHTFDMKFNKNDRKISFVVKSPYLNGETLKIESSVEGTLDKNFNFNALLRFDSKTFAVKFNFKNAHQLLTSLEVKTPFRGYRKINFVASYEKSDKIFVTFSASKPLDMSLEIELGKDKDEYVSMVSISTPINGYEKISARATIPMNKISPMLQVDILDYKYLLGFEIINETYSKKLHFDINAGGERYSAGSEIRYKAPYELGYSYNFLNLSDKFHIMTDSSMLRAVLLPISGLY